MLGTVNSDWKSERKCVASHEGVFMGAPVEAPRSRPELLGQHSSHWSR